MRKIAVVASVVAGAAAPMAAVAPSASAQTAPAWVAYHNLSASDSVARVKQLKAQGFRPITVNVSDGERYAAVWVKDGSAAEWGIWQGMSPAEFQQRFDAALKEGAQPISVSATGSGSSVVFTAIFQKKGGRFVTKSNLTSAQFGALNKEAASKGLALASIDAYGDPGDVRYVATWTANTGGAWYYSYGKSREAHEDYFYAKKKQGFRPVGVAVAPDGTYSAIWRKDGVNSWAHYIDMSSSGYQKRFDDLKGKGLAPVQVNAENGRYAAIWQ
ncbi:hypothetical protein [Nonomuraea zeae]|uniref:Beta-lactamase n=1 Tax=Nonomuraea zeae TaxID=1642303 RepID=A0A5S4GL13_9ACTN|nr:hypothetical protein [Nonomuraea zeae]TMR33573.1 hypothetical protein ETD85_19630 [Nonomuraea zeae]